MVPNGGKVIKGKVAKPAVLVIMVVMVVVKTDRERTNGDQIQNKMTRIGLVKVMAR